jgi:hypothetical protein
MFWFAVPSIESSEDCVPRLKKVWSEDVAAEVVRTFIVSATETSRHSVLRHVEVCDYSNRAIDNYG